MSSIPHEIFRSQIEKLIHIKHLKSAEVVWRASERALQKILTPSLFKKFTSFKNGFDITRHVNKIEADKVNSITIEEDSYPRLLKEMSDPSPVLYVKGGIPNNKRVG